MSDKRTIAIFGAGTGLGAALAARFGREGYRVALVARRAEERAAELARSGVEAVAFPADLTDVASIPALVRAIEDRMESIDVAIYCPVPANAVFVAAVELDAAKAQSLAPIFCFAPIEVSHCVIPGMLARGDGAIVIVSGVSAVFPEPEMSGPGPLLAATRNFVLSLNAEVMPRGVYAGSVSIGAAIARSGHLREIAAGEIPVDPGYAIIDPDEIAEEIWALVARRDQAELVIAPRHQA